MEKFSAKYINQIDTLKNAIVGFEFEFYCDKLPYYSLIEKLNNYLAPIKVHGFKEYHSEFKPEKMEAKLEMDYSGGLSMCELISAPMSYVDAKIFLLKTLNFLNEFCYTTDKSSLHVNISFDKDKTDKTLDKLNPLKLILNIDEDYVYKYFPERRNNIYARSVKKMIPFKNYQFSSDALNIIQNNLELPDTKYYGVNINNYINGRLEFRYIGWNDYHKKVEEILDLTDYFILLTAKCIDAKLDDDDKEELLEYLNKNISLFKSYNKYEGFIGEFPSIQLQVDKDSSFSIINTYYDSFYSELFDVLQNIYNLENAIINFDVDTKKLEIVNASFKTIYDLKNLIFIDCVIDSGDYFASTFINCDLRNTHISNCNLDDCTIFNSKISDSIITGGELTNCFLTGSLLGGYMSGGVYRNNKMTDQGEISPTTKISNDNIDYFGIKDKIDLNKKGKGDIPNKTGKVW